MFPHFESNPPSRYSRYIRPNPPSANEASSSVQRGAIAVRASADDYSLNAIAAPTTYPSHYALADLPQSGASPRAGGQEFGRSHQDYSLNAIVSPHEHASYPSALPHWQSDASTQVCGDAFARSHGEGTLDALVMSGTGRAESPWYAASPAVHDLSVPIVEADRSSLDGGAHNLQPHDPFAHRSMDPILLERHFSDRQCKILKVLTDHPGQVVTNAMISKDTKLDREQINNQISKINQRLSLLGAKPVLRLMFSSRTTQSCFVLEPAVPVILRRSERYQLMQNSFSGLSAEGNVHSTALREDEFSLLERLIDNGHSGASKDDLEPILYRTAPRSTRLNNVISNLNTRLNRTTLSIQNTFSPPHPAHYILVDSYHNPPPEPPH